MPPKRRIESSSVLFDVLYVDGSRTSNRKVASLALATLDGDAPAKSIIEAQDREIARASGRPRPDIRSVSRTSAKVAARD